MKKNYLFLLAAILSSPMAEAQQLNPYTTEMITEQPAGTLYNHVMRSGTYFRNTSGTGLAFGGYTGYFGDYVLADDGTLYVKNPLPEYRNGNWLRLDRVGDGQYVAHTPQPIDDLGDGLELYVTRLELSDPERVTYSVNTSNLDLPFTFEDGTLTMADDNGTSGSYGAPKVILGITDLYGTWYGYADAASIFSPMVDEAAVKPDALAASDYVLSHTVCDPATGQASTERELVKVAIDGQDVYINNPQTHDPKYWVKGTVAGDDVAFLAQYVGPDSATYTHRWFLPATYTPSTFNDGYGIGYTRSHATMDALLLAYDAQAGTMKAEDGTSMVFSVSGQMPYHEVGFDDVALQPFHEVEATPAAPSVVRFTPWSNSTGYGLFTFSMPAADSEGNFINPGKLYYNIYIDDEETPFTLRNDEYFALPVAEMTDIPYDFNTGWVISADGNERSFYLYTADLDCIGVQSVYRGAGAEHRSAIAWYVNQTAGVNGVKGTPQAAVTGESYYDLSGRRVGRPRQGSLYVKETTFADGSKKVEKALGR